MKNMFVLFVLSIPLGLFGQTETNNKVVDISSNIMDHVGLIRSAERYEASTTVAETWKIEYKYIGSDCMITYEDEAKRRQLNEEADKVLSIRKGANWKEVLKLEIEEEVVIQKKWKDILAYHNILNQLATQAGIEIKELEFNFHRKEGQKNYYLNIGHYVPTERTSLFGINQKWVPLGKYFLDNRTNSVNPISI